MKIIELLSAGQLRRLESFCRERYRTADAIRAWVKRAGFPVSRNAALFWRKQFQGTTRAGKSSSAFPRGAAAPDESALRVRIVELLASVTARSSLNIVLETVAQSLAIEIAGRNFSAARASGRTSGPAPCADEMLRRFRVMQHRAERIGPHSRLCPLCGVSVVGLDKHLKRMHMAHLMAMPAEAFT
jgi:hypothetical protein